MAELVFDILLGLLASAAVAAYIYERYVDYWYKSKESISIYMSETIDYNGVSRNETRSKYGYLTHRHHCTSDRNYINNQLGITLGVF